MKFADRKLLDGYSTTIVIPFVYPAQVPFENSNDVGIFFRDDGERAHREEGLRRGLKLQLSGILNLKDYISGMINYLLTKAYQSHSVLGSKM
jgi:hypothetical protein